MDYYFAKPYHCREIGVNENLNGLVRQYFKKSTDFSNLTEQQIKPV
jgi:IS30 family transposase